MGISGHDPAQDRRRHERCAVHNSREVAARVEALNPRLRAEVVPRTTHALPLERPDLVISRILTLVEDDKADLSE